MDQLKMSQLQKEVQAFVEKRIKELDLDVSGKQLLVSLKFEFTPVSIVKVVIDSRQRNKSPKRYIVDRPLTEDEWEKLRGLPYPPNNRFRQTLHLYDENGNQPITGQELMRKVLGDRGFMQMQQFNNFLKKKGVNCALRSTGATQKPWEEQEFKIFAVK